MEVMPFCDKPCLLSMFLKLTILGCMPYEWMQKNNEISSIKILCILGYLLIIMRTRGLKERNVY